MIDKVITIRNKLQSRMTVCSPTPGWYLWWCDREAAAGILGQLEINLNELLLLNKEIDGKNYIAIYFGISKKLSDRIKWHICQNHTEGSVRSGFLSTLRQTLSALLNSDMSKSKHLVDKFMDDNCYLEYDNTVSHFAAKNKEKQELSRTDCYYPLNISGAKSTPEEIKNKLTILRKLHKR